ELDVQLARAAVQELDSLAPVEDAVSGVGRLPLEVDQRLVDVLVGGSSVSVDALEQPVGGEDHQPRILEAHEHREYVGPLPEREGGLVAVVAVRDQQLAAGERLGDAIGGKAPQARTLNLEVRAALRARGRRRSLVEEEQRLELRLNLTQETQA